MIELHIAFALQTTVPVEPRAAPNAPRPLQ
jgi:hypothetical protein